MLALLVAYFDESGIHAGAKATSISGFIASTEVWKNIECEWKEQLDTFGIPYFHAAECKAGRGPFASVRKEFRNVLPMNLAKIICKHKPAGLSNVVLRDDWDQTDWSKPGAITLKNRYPEPYDMCFDAAMQQMDTYSTHMANGEPVAIVIAEQTQFRDRVNIVCNAYRNHQNWANRFVSLTFARPSNLIPLQAADMMVNETYHHSLSFLIEKKEIAGPIIKSFIQADVPLYGGYYDREALDFLIENGPNGLLS